MHAAQPQQHPPDTAAGGPGGEASGRTAGSLRLGTDMQMTDATAAPAVLADADSAGMTAVATAVPDTPMARAGAAGRPDSDIGANIEAAGLFQSACMLNCFSHGHWRCCLLCVNIEIVVED